MFTTTAVMYILFLVLSAVVVLIIGSISRILNLLCSPATWTRSNNALKPNKLVKSLGTFLSKSSKSYILSSLFNQVISKM